MSDSAQGFGTQPALHAIGQVLTVATASSFSCFAGRLPHLPGAEHAALGSGHIAYVVFDSHSLVECNYRFLTLPHFRDDLQRCAQPSPTPATALTNINLPLYP